MSEIFTKVENLAKRGVIVEFKEFINRGNVIDLAVAFVMGAAFKTVVDSFAGSDKGPGILGGLIGAIFGGQQPDFSKKVLTINGSDIPFGSFATSAMNFFFVALALFMVVKLYNRFRSNDDKEKAALNTNDLLVEIRDELRATRNNGQQ
ncbi:MAG: large conductance mechanosensitive channel protein MscL [Actinobacteria bacterium]|jgi:large conductance mechanosensitive channel|nr:large conductance mechanosensitive channel protein MscL [Actinomycetota bacterium]